MLLTTKSNFVSVLQRDVAVVDCQLPGISGPQVAAEIKRRGLPTKVLAPSTGLRAALSAYDEDRYLWGVWSAGALGYLLKNEAPGAIVTAVRTVAQGERLWTSEQLARVQRWREEVEQRWKSLTEREREVLLLIAAGKSNKEIAQALEVTAWTVGFHLKRLGVESRVEAAVWAKEHRTIS